MKWMIGIAIVVMVIVTAAIAPWINRVTRAGETMVKEKNDMNVDIARQQGLEVATFSMG